MGRSRSRRHLDQRDADDAAARAGARDEGLLHARGSRRLGEAAHPGDQRRSPAPRGEVGAYNDAFFERGTRGVKSRRTSLIVDPPDGRIPALTPEAQRKVDARQKHEAVSPADRPEDRWLTERCILFGATVPMLPEPYNNNYRILQSPGYVTIMVEMNHDARVIPLDGRAHLSSQVQQWIGDSRGRFEGNTLIVETRNLKFNEKSRFGVGLSQRPERREPARRRALHADRREHADVSGDD